jgi:predicted 3-demethylubiquinone-9 3-methyltransferase (glyoxalase superfamily)
MASAITPFLMFEGAAEEAMRFYVSLFGDGEITAIERYGADGPGGEGTVKLAVFRLCGREFRCSDSPVAHAFSFTPSLSLLVECTHDTELAEAFARLAEGGKVLMPLDDYGFSRRFGWVEDRFGVSWQLNLAD